MRKYIYLDETDSTSIYLKNLLAEKTLEEGTVVYTDFQTAGKGQRGNNWESEKGENILFSMVLYPKTIYANQQFIISQLASLAIKDVLSKYADDITIKWPNDIFWRDKKICGILIENNLLDDKISQSILGIGININQETFVSDAPNPISLKQITNKEYNTSEILQDIVDRIMIYYKNVENCESESIIKNYKSSLFRSEGYHLYNDGTKDFFARFEEIEPTGILVLETDLGEKRTFAFKEIRYKL